MCFLNYEDFENSVQYKIYTDFKIHMIYIKTISNIKLKQSTLFRGKENKADNILQYQSLSVLILIKEITLTVFDTPSCGPISVNNCQPFYVFF